VQRLGEVKRSEEVKVAEDAKLSQVPNEEEREKQNNLGIERTLKL
jgi:hypothetical protein